MQISLNDTVQQKDHDGFIHHGQVIELRIGARDEIQARVRWHGGYSTWEIAKSLTVIGKG